MAKYFLTGASGCIGGWVAKNFVERGDEVFALVRNPSNINKLELIMDKNDITKMHLVHGDVTDLKLISETLKKYGVERIIHLAGMQLPLCRLDPPLGARVNVEGTVNIFWAALEAGIEQVVYSSSTAVYGGLEDYPGGVFDHHSPLLPKTFYGVYKMDNELSAKVFFNEKGISSIGIRPFVVYGPLRDQGLTSTPTTAIKCAVKGESYEISYGGKCDFQYTNDAAIAFIQAADTKYTGAECFNLGGGSTDMADIVATIEQVLPSAKGNITYINSPLPFAEHKDTGELEKVIGSFKRTTLLDGITKSVNIFKEAQK